MNHQARANGDSTNGQFRPRRPRVLLSAHACGPGLGSEPGIGWGRATEIARYCDVWVLVCGDYWPQQISAYLEQHGPIPNLRFVFVPRGPWESAIADLPILQRVTYRAWLRRAFRVAQQLHAQVGFDIAHQVNIVGFREPSHLYRLNIPFVWGPMGGAQDYPWRFLRGAGLSGAAFEAARSVVNWIEMHASPRVRAAAKSAAAIFAANSETKRKFQQALGVNPILLCDVGIPTLGNNSLGAYSDSDAIRILWVGRLITRKSLELLIEALALLPDGVPYELRVIGDGPRRRQLQCLAQEKGISANIRWFGAVDHQEALEHFCWADTLAFTSLRDTSGTVMLEAFAVAKPVVCLDHQGAGDIVTPQCGIKIPVTNRCDTQQRLCDALALLQRDRRHCQALGQGARRRAAEYLWSFQTRRIAEEYNRILESVDSDARCDLNDAAELDGEGHHDNPFDAATASVGVQVR